jgi:hypothetical protein
MYSPSARRSRYLTGTRPDKLGPHRFDDIDAGERQGDVLDFRTAAYHGL